MKEKRLRASGSWDIQVEGAAGGGHSADMMQIFDFMGIPWVFNGDFTGNIMFVFSSLFLKYMCHSQVTLAGYGRMCWAVWLDIATVGFAVPTRC